MSKFANKSHMTIKQWKKEINNSYPASDFGDNLIGRYHRIKNYIINSAGKLTEKQYDSLLVWASSLENKAIKEWCEESFDDNKF